MAADWSPSAGEPVRVSPPPGRAAHADTAHADTAHADTAHADTAHADSARVDNAPASKPHWAGVIGVPLAIFAATRLAQLTVLAWINPPGTGLHARLMSWDAGWFVRVATEGYPHGYAYDAAGQVTGNGFAFFPLYPGLIRAGILTGLSGDTSALVVATIAGGIAAVLLSELGRSMFADHGPTIARRAGYALAALVCAQPMSIVFSMGYSEPVFVAAVAGMLLTAYRRHWLAAGLLGAAAGLTRPTGAAAGVALAVAAVICLASRDRSAGERVRASIGALIALAAVPAYILWVGLRVGELNAWFRIQSSGWGTTFDYGRASFVFIRDTLRTGDGWVGVSVALFLIAAMIAVVVAVRAKLWPPLLVYGVIAFILAVGQAGYYHSKPRLLVPVLIVFVPAALAAGRARTRVAVCGLIGFAAFGLWYGAYMITVWHYAI